MSKDTEILISAMFEAVRDDPAIDITTVDTDYLTEQVEIAVLLHKTFIQAEADRLHAIGETTYSKEFYNRINANVSANIRAILYRYKLKICDDYNDYLKVISTIGDHDTRGLYIEGKGLQPKRAGCYSYNQETDIPRAPEQQSLDYGGYYSWTKELIREINQISWEWEKQAQETRGQEYENIFDAALYNFKNKFYDPSNNVALYTNLAGEFSSNIPGHDNAYSNISPAGDPEDHHLYINLEEFEFQEDDVQRLKEVSLKEAQETYKAIYNTAFTTWLYKIFYNNLQDLYRTYKTRMKRGYKIKSVEEFEEYTATFNITRDQAIGDVLHFISHNTWAKLKPYHKEWLILFYQVDPARMEHRVMAEILEPDKSEAAREKREQRARQELRELLIPTVKQKGIEPFNTSHCKDETPALVCSGYDEQDETFCRFVHPCDVHPCKNIKCCNSDCVEYKPIIRHEFERYSLRTWPQLSSDHIRRRENYLRFVECEILAGRECYLPGLNINTICQNVCSYRII